MGAVHAGDVHTVARQPSDEVGPVGSFARQRDHDACGSGSRRGTEQAFGVAIQQVLSLAEADSQVVRALLLARQTIEHAEHGLDGGQHVRLGSSQRRDAEHGEPALKVADIVVAQLDVVHKVRRRGPVCGVCGLDLGAPLSFGGHQSGVQIAHLRTKGDQFGVVGRSLHHSAGYEPLGERKMTADGTFVTSPWSYRRIP